jgi:predicted AAA+ superfamily ATPase
MNETGVLSILADWNFWGNFQESLRNRNLYIDKIEQLFSDRLVTVLFGVRRAGKSSMTYLFLQKRIREKQIDGKNTLIINLEDPRFPPKMDSSDLFRVYEIYLKQLDPAKPVIVLDEAQNVQDWEKFVRYLVEAKKSRVVVTGSSSKLLASEISTALTGRHVDIEVFPLSFKELLEFRGVQIETMLEMAKERIRIKRMLDEYAEWGGFPEVVLSNTALRKRELLTRYFDDIVIKDVVKRFGIREIEKLERLANIFIANIATLQSYNKLKVRVGASLDTVERFSRYLEMARMFFYMKRFDYSVGRQVRSINKVYAIDPGLYSVKGFRFSENYGKIAENLVAIELFRQRSFNSQLEIFYWKDYHQKEVDFVIKEGIRIKQLIQVCWHLSATKTHKREVTSLLKASAELQCHNLFVITNDYEATEEMAWNGHQAMIQYLPLWKWLLL